MAKINAHGARQIGPTFFTTKVRIMPRSGGMDIETVFVEAFRLRSDGVVQTRIIRTRPASGEPGEGYATEHRGSSYRNLGRLKAYDPNTTTIREGKDMLQAWLERKGFTITKETYR